MKKIVLKTSIFWVFTGIVVLALFSIPKLSFTLLGGEISSLGTVSGIATAGVLLCIVWRHHSWLAALVRRPVHILARIPVTVWLIALIVIGILLRYMWAVSFPAPLSSDGATYFGLAERLLKFGYYRDAVGNYAYWPPGYPFALYAVFMLTGAKTWVIVLINLLAYSLSILIAWRLAQLLFNEAVAKFSTLIVALWPNAIFCTVVASKEMLLVLLLPLALLLYIYSTRSAKRGGIYALVTGATLGFASLTQPSMLLFPAVLALYEYLTSDKWGKSAIRMAIILLGMGMVIAPWAVRNYSIFDTPVLISTNGGDVIYRANNPLATGGYIPAGERDLQHYGEIERNKLGYQWAKEWIVAHPASFLMLAVKKQILFLGDDANGVYETLKRGLGITDLRYPLIKGLSNAYWLAIWVLLLVMLRRSHSTGAANNPAVILLMLSVLYFFAIDSVFESGSRHHLPLIVILSTLASMTVLKSAEASPSVRSGRPAC